MNFGGLWCEPGSVAMMEIDLAIGAYIHHTDAFSLDVQECVGTQVLRDPNYPFPGAFRV